MIRIHIIHEKLNVNRDGPKKNSALTEINHEKNWRDMTSRSIFFKPGIFGMRSWNYKNTEVSSILHEDLEEQCIEASIHSGTQHTT